MKGKRSFDPILVNQLRDLPVIDVLDLLRLDWKVDRDFSPLKSHETIRLNVAVGSGGFELVVTGRRWFDTRAEKGGFGGIDLSMHLLKLDFVGAVKRLLSCQLERNSGLGRAVTDRSVR